MAECITKGEAEGFFVGGRRISLEKGRLLNRSDRLGEAIVAHFEATKGLREGEWWRMLAVLYEAKAQADEELSRLRGGPPA
ncbi:MAG TPA: hypothetical protein VFI90_09690 [Rubrobacter sp.]|nr:hypothetical protein [Rubrobacter sp.]